MSVREQVLVISASATSFTAVCDACSATGGDEGYAGSTFAGRLDLDLHHGSFLCRRGHRVRVERRLAPPAAESAAA